MIYASSVEILMFCKFGCIKRRICHVALWGASGVESVPFAVSAYQMSNSSLFAPLGASGVDFVIVCTFGCIMHPVDLSDKRCLW
jgi:hypothetical protein